MPRINLIPDPPAEDPAPLEPNAVDLAQQACAWCLGLGRYVGFIKVEDPCQFCKGTGRAEETPGQG